MSIAEQWVRFAVEPVELAVNNPGILHEFALTCNIRIVGNKIESGSLFLNPSAAPRTLGRWRSHRRSRA